MTDMKDRGAAAGDAACLWHLLDRLLPVLCEVRDDLAEAGLEELADGLRGPIEKAEARYDEAEGEVAKLLGDGRKEPRW